MRTILIIAALFGLSLDLMAQAYTPAQNPVGPTSWWWDQEWWEAGQIPVPDNHRVRVEWTEYPGDDTTVPAMVARPDDDKAYPAVLYQHGRRGLDELVQGQVKRIAARGFVVLAPDLYTAHFIEKLPIEHDYTLEQDVGRGLDVLLARSDVSTDRACLASHTRGGYMTLKTATTQQRQQDAAACYVSWYPHLQDPNAPEPMQVYRYAPEVDALLLPTLIFIGDQEQYQRRRSIETAVASLRESGRTVQLVVYPGVGRGFDFRPPHVRTLADDLASQDAVQRAARFMRAMLAPFGKQNPREPGGTQ